MIGAGTIVLGGEAGYQSALSTWSAGRRSDARGGEVSRMWLNGSGGQ